MFRSLLIPLDLSLASNRVVQRGRFLPLAPGAELTLLHVVPRALPRRDKPRAEAAARKALSEFARTLSRHLPDKVRVNQLVKTGAAAAEIADTAQRSGADLVAMGRGGRRAFRDAFLGSTAERVIRRTRLPVLVCRTPAHGHYRRPLLALAKDQAAEEVLKATLRILPSPLPSLAVVHAYDIPYYGMIYPNLSGSGTRELHQDFRRTALNEIAELVAAARGGRQDSVRDRLRWKGHIRHGSPRSVIPQTAARTQADLLVLGTHGYTGIAHALLGTVAGDVLRAVQCDVLVVPPRPPSPTGFTDRRRRGR